MHDLVVVGGGPVGLGTAILAAQAGLSVVVLERRAYPVDKACGEGLLPPALAALRDLGVDPPGRTIAGLAYVSEDGRFHVSARFRSAQGRGVRRTALSAALHARARELGADVRQGAVERVRQDADGVDAAGVRARWAIAADGLHSPIRAQLGLDRSARGQRFGLRRHYCVRPWSDCVEVHWAGLGEAYVTPVDEGLVGVALLTASRRPYAEVLAAFPALRERLAGAVPAGPVRGAGPLRQRVRGVRTGRILLVGDAAGYVDALTGEGIAVGLAAARELVAAVAADDIERYAARAARVTRRSRLLTLGLLAATRPAPVRARLVPVVARLPLAYAAVAGQVAMVPCDPVHPATAPRASTAFQG